MAKEKLYLVMKSKSWYGNVLAYNPKTSEYVYLKFGKEIWREKSDSKLFDYVQYAKNNNAFVDVEEERKLFPVFAKYEQSCHED